MTLLVPLGLLGLLSLIVLLIIYIIRPNYQQRVISSTYIWKLSLKYKKKRVPISKLRNLLLILCQILALVCCSFILAQPGKILLAKETGDEIVIIIDSSASMRVESVLDEATGEYQNRFQRAIIDAIDLADYTFRKEGKVSVIIADDTPEFLIGSRLTYERANELYNTLNELAGDPYACSYGEADVEKALQLCEDIIFINESTAIHLYTDTEYLHLPTGVNLHNVDYEEEWNISILDAYATLEDNFYNYTIELGSYGRPFVDCAVMLEIKGVNEEEQDIRVVQKHLDFEQDIVYTLNFRSQPLDSSITVPENTIICDLPLDIYLYNNVHVSVVDSVATDPSGKPEIYYEDNFYEDNEIYIYGGQKSPLNVQYTSTLPNPFINAALFSMSALYADRYEFSISSTAFIEEAKTEGFDLYIYEHNEMPPTLPVDGVSLIIAPQANISGTGVIIGNEQAVSVAGGIALDKTADHPLLKGMDASSINITSYFSVVDYDSAYEVVLSAMGQPIMLVCNTNQTKVVYLNFSLHYSNFPLLIEFPLFFHNLFEYFFPPMVQSNVFEVNKGIDLSTRGNAITLKGFEFEQVYTEFPVAATVSLPGSYTLSQELFSGEILTEQIYVKIPYAEGNCFPEADTVYNPYANSEEKNFVEDWLLYFAIGLTALLFAEWLLHLREDR